MRSVGSLESVSLQGGVATGHNVGHAGIICFERVVSESAGVVSLIRCRLSIDGVGLSTRLGLVLPDIDDSYDFVKKSVGATTIVVIIFPFQRVMMWCGLGGL